jgi:hypothetical protein
MWCIAFVLCLVAHTCFVQSERRSEGIEELDMPGADCNISNRDGATALHFAADKVIGVCQTRIFAIRSPKGRW